MKYLIVLMKMSFDIGPEKAYLSRKLLSLVTFVVQCFPDFIVHMFYNDLHIDTRIKFYPVNGIVDLICAYSRGHLVTFLFVFIGLIKDNFEGVVLDMNRLPSVFFVHRDHDCIIKIVSNDFFYSDSRAIVIISGSSKKYLDVISCYEVSNLISAVIKESLGCDRGHLVPVLICFHTVNVSSVSQESSVFQRVRVAGKEGVPVSV